jgi:hypothetical protein
VKTLTPFVVVTLVLAVLSSKYLKADIMSGEKLVNQCMEAHTLSAMPFEEGYCLGYLAAVADTSALLMDLEWIPNTRLHCRKNIIENEAVLTAFINYTKSDEATAEAGAASTVIKALRKTWPPCHENAPETATNCNYSVRQDQLVVTRKTGGSLVKHRRSSRNVFVNTVQYEEAIRESATIFISKYDDMCR